MKKITRNIFVAVALSICLSLSIVLPNGGATVANAEYSDCWYDHEHVEATGYSTGDTYLVEKGFGSDVVYEAVKLEDDEIVVDGFKDDVWYDAYEIESFVVTENQKNDRKTRIVASYMWDDENLYVWAEIYDNTYTLSWDNGTDWAAWGDYCELYVDTLHNSSLAADNWDGKDGATYRGKNPNSGTWPDGSEYEDCCFGKFKISAGFNQTLDTTNVDTKKGRGGAVEWYTWSWLAAACKEDDVSLFTSAFMYKDRDLGEPYTRYQTKGGIQNGAELALGRPIGYTFEAQINFKSSNYMPEDGSIIGAGLRIADMTDISWWADMGGDYCIYAQESNAGDMWEKPRNLPNLALLPGEGGSSGASDDKEYTVKFEVDGKVVSSVTGPKKTEVVAPEDPVKPGYTFIGWQGYKEGYTIRNDTTFVAKFERTMEHLPEWPALKNVQDYDYEALPDDYTVNVYEAEKTSAVIEIDGVLDDAYWQEAKAIEIVELIEGDSEVMGFAYILWDDENIYVYVVVEDPDVAPYATGERWNSDSVELVLDTYNQASGKEQAYGDGYRGSDYVGEGQFRINAGEKTLSGMHWMFDNADVAKSGASRIIEGEGYTAEFKIAWGSFKDKADLDEQIAFSIVINDGEANTRYGIVAIEPDQNHAYEWAGVLSKLYLVDNEETIIPEPVQPEAPSANDQDTPKGFSVGAIVGISVGGVVIVAIAGFLVFWLVIKKKSLADLFTSKKG